ncbi:hypothetical protein BaRGS_00040281 [Batillaria attramentaria]|uniref:Uncharacterized protein n=1 Tax=Batillaria attramentaria TaxID=370345 RepID=A0ABD0J0P0_9CAEN
MADTHRDARGPAYTLCGGLAVSPFSCQTFVRFLRAFDTEHADAVLLLVFRSDTVSVDTSYAFVSASVTAFIRLASGPSKRPKHDTPGKGLVSPGSVG